MGFKKYTVETNPQPVILEEKKEQAVESKQQTPPEKRSH